MSAEKKLCGYLVYAANKLNQNTISSSDYGGIRDNARKVKVVLGLLTAQFQTGEAESLSVYKQHLVEYEKLKDNLASCQVKLQDHYGAMPAKDDAYSYSVWKTQLAGLSQLSDGTQMLISAFEHEACQRVDVLVKEVGAGNVPLVLSPFGVYTVQDINVAMYESSIASNSVIRKQLGYKWSSALEKAGLAPVAQSL